MTVIPIRRKRLRLLTNYVRATWPRNTPPRGRHPHTWVDATRHADASTRELCTTCGLTRRDS